MVGNVPLDSDRSQTLVFSRQRQLIVCTPRNRHLPSRPPVDALRGSLDLLILKTLSLSAMHGWGISQRVQQMSSGEFAMNQGSLYPALQRLEQTGVITSEWGVTDHNRQARYYRLTAAGRRALDKELESWKRFAAALEAVLRTT
jgi:PadR family transcriptional regulator, regulatory protein PadR